jgi:hypothetical protein
MDGLAIKMTFVTTSELPETTHKFYTKASRVLNLTRLKQTLNLCASGFFFFNYSLGANLTMFFIIILAWLL